MYAIVRDTPLSWEDYRLLAAELGAGVPEGLVIRVAGRTAEGVRAIEIWRSREELDRFEREQLRPAQERVPAPLAPETVRALAVELVREGVRSAALPSPHEEAPWQLKPRD